MQITEALIQGRMTELQKARAEGVKQMAQIDALLGENIRLLQWLRKAEETEAQTGETETPAATEAAAKEG